ncbi:hypothetical protein R9X47_28445 [Wukongibacter baidiensis]|uniref:hypothetical protein n=1 Tax=Wukongibacter baidiensis TaxID=1723361 RepID=UPI003D7FB79B
MKRNLSIFIFIIMIMNTILSGCADQITANKSDSLVKKETEINTYTNEMKDGKVEIDGIWYDIRSVSKTTNTYDDNENAIEKVTIHDDDSEMRFEYLYENNQLIENRSYSNGEVSFTTYYYYEDDLMIKRKSVSKGGLEVVTEYSYGNKIKKQTHYASDGRITFIAIAYLDDDNKILKAIDTTADGEVMTSSTFHYENDLLTKVISEKDGVIVKTFNYEYNNVGDKIMEYIIFYGKVNTLVAVFYDYEYDENLLPKTVTVYRVQSPIADEDIRDYQ